MARGYLGRVWDAVRGRTPDASASRRSLFAGAQVSRLTADWVTSPLVSGRRELSDLPTLRGRSRQLARDSAVMRRYLLMREENVVGPQGITLQMRSTDAALNRAVEAWWAGVCESTEVDPAGVWTVHDLAREADRLRAMDGEAFYRWRTGRGAYGVVLQVLDADQIDVGYHREAEQGKPEVRSGVEVDTMGRPLAYHVFTEHPEDGATRGRRERVRIMARDILHVWHRMRPGQTRGLPDVYPVLMTMKMVEGYEEAAVVAARAGAHKLGFLVAKDGVGGGLADGASSPLPMDSEPGTWSVLDGYDVQSYDPAFPNIQHDAFLKAFRRSIAIGFGVSYHALFGDLESVNFSSGRLGEAAMRDRWRLEQQRMVQQFYRPVFARLVERALAMGAIARVSIGRLDEILAAQTWRPRGWEPVDPVKDAAATSAALAMGLTTFADEAARRGMDWDDNVARLAVEYAQAQTAGVPLRAALPDREAGAPMISEEDAHGNA